MITNIKDFRLDEQNKFVTHLSKNPFVTYLYKNTDKLKEFMHKLRDQLHSNDRGRKIISQYVKTGNISESDAALLRVVCIDTLKMLGLGTLAIVIPGGTVLVVALAMMAKKSGVELMPSQFETNK